MKHRPYLSATNALLDTTDWSRTPLGDPAHWPLSLRSYVSMVMSMPTPAIIFWGPDLTQIYNDGYAQIMGPRHPRFFGAPYRECWPDTYPLIYPWMRKVLDHGEVVEVDREHIPVTRFGFEEDAYFTFTFSPLRDDEGRPAGILQPVFEVTRNVLAERRARLLRDLSTLEGSGQGLWDAAIGILAATREDIPHAAFWQADADGGMSLIATTGDDGSAREAPPPAVVSQVARTGERAWMDAPRGLVLPLETGAARGARAVLVARTNPRLHEDAEYVQFLEMVAVGLSSAMQRAHAVSERERQRAFLQGLFLQAPAGIAVLRGPRHVFELVNPLYRAIIGGRDVVGKALVEALPEMRGQPFVATLDNVYRTGEPYVGLGESTMLTRSPGAEPEKSFFNFVYQPLDDDLQGRGILVFCYEVTQQVLARRHSEQLAEALRQEHTRKDEFLAMLAHELRNPLAPVRSAAELLLRAPGDEAMVRKASAIIARQVQHMAGLVGDLLDVSRVTRGLVAIERQPEDLRAVILEAVEQTRPLAESKSHRLTVELPERSLSVMGDHKRLVQIFANLLHNASKFTPDQGLVNIRMEASGTEALVVVSDTGMGIDAELLPRIFDLFVQGRRGAARTEGGLGIGLPLVRMLAKMHGGSVTAFSDGDGRGSRFEVRLPLLVGAGEDVASSSRKASPVRGTGRVLVVDDNVDAAQTLSMQLQGLGYEVDVTYRGRDALDACARNRYVACVLDIGLPDLPGTEVASRIRAESANAPPLLVAVSGYGQEADVRLAREAGFDHYEVKPVDLLPLSHLLRERTARDARHSAAASSAEPCAGS